MGFLLSNVFGPEKDARFFFYVYNVVKILLSILSVTEYHSRVKYIISLDFAITPNIWAENPDLLFVPPVFILKCPCINISEYWNVHPSTFWRLLLHKDTGLCPCPIDIPTRVVREYPAKQLRFAGWGASGVREWRRFLGKFAGWWLLQVREYRAIWSLFAGWWLLRVREYRAIW